MVIAKEKLKKTRIDSGITIRDLSKHSGVPIATISRAENGKPLSVKSAHKLCTVFHMSFDDLFILQKEEG